MVPTYLKGSQAILLQTIKTLCADQVPCTYLHLVTLTGYHPTTISRAISCLEAQGYIRVTRPGNGKANRYEVVEGVPV